MKHMEGRENCSGQAPPPDFPHNYWYDLGLSISLMWAAAPSLKSGGLVRSTLRSLSVLKISYSLNFGLVTM